MKAWGIPTNSPKRGGDAWRELCFTLSLAADLDDGSEILDLLHSARNGSPYPEEWWPDMVRAMRPVCEEQPELLTLLGLPAVANPFTLAVSVARNMQTRARARCGYPDC